MDDLSLSLFYLLFEVTMRVGGTIGINNDYCFFRGRVYYIFLIVFETFVS